MCLSLLNAPVCVTTFLYIVHSDGHLWEHTGGSVFCDAYFEM